MYTSQRKWLIMNTSDGSSNTVISSPNGGRSTASPSAKKTTARIKGGMEMARLTINVQREPSAGPYRHKAGNGTFNAEARPARTTANGNSARHEKAATAAPDRNTKS